MGNVCETMGAHHVLFKDRLDAGIQLGRNLASLQGKPVTVVGLARGGVLVASAAASALGIATDVLVVRKLSSPANREFAIGAVAPDDVRVIHWRDVLRVGMDEYDVQREVARLSGEIAEQSRRYRRGMRPMSVKGKTVVLVDDGAATGATMEAAVLWARKKKAHRIIAAVPVLSKDAADVIRPEVAELIALRVEEHLGSVGEFYEEFPQVTDEEVIQSLHI